MPIAHNTKALHDSPAKINSHPRLLFASFYWNWHLITFPVNIFSYSTSSSFQLLCGCVICVDHEHLANCRLCPVAINFDADEYEFWTEMAPICWWNWPGLGKHILILDEKERLRRRKEARSYRSVRHLSKILCITPTSTKPVTRVSDVLKGGEALSDKLTSSSRLLILW